MLEATRLLDDRPTADYYERCVAASRASPRQVLNWVHGELAAALKQSGLGVAQAPVDSARLAGLLNRMEDGSISGKLAKQVFAQMWESGEEADAIIDRQGLRQLSGAESLQPLIDQVIDEHPKQLEQYLAGKQKVFSYFVGQIMKATGGQANPTELSAMLRRSLDGKK